MYAVKTPLLYAGAPEKRPASLPPRTFDIVMKEGEAGIMRGQEQPAESRAVDQANHAAAARYIAAVASHDQRALADLYDATVSRVYGLALRIVRSRQAAEEVAADVYVQVWKSAASFDPTRGKPVAWLLTICRSRALDYLRREDPADVHPEPETLVDVREAGGGRPAESVAGLRTQPAAALGA